MVSLASWQFLQFFLSWKVLQFYFDSWKMKKPNSTLGELLFSSVLDNEMSDMSIIKDSYHRKSTGFIEREVVFVHSAKLYSWKSPEIKRFKIRLLAFQCHITNWCFAQ